MKKGFKNLFCVLLGLGLLASGLSSLSPEDARRDLRIDLKDTILNLQQLTDSAVNQETFKNDLQNAFETFFVLAGLKTVIKEDHSKTSGTAFWALGSPYLMSSSQLFILKNRGTVMPDRTFRYYSNCIAPASPPPKTV